MRFIVTDGSDPYGIQSPLDITYMKILRILLIMIGAWPGKALGERELLRYYFQRINMTVSCSCLVVIVMYIRDNIEKLSFFDKGQCYITLLINVICLIRLISLVFSSKLDDTIVDFIKDKHLFNHRNDSKFAGKISHYIHKISFAYTLYQLIPLAVIATFFNLPPLINNMSKGAFTGPLPANESYDHSVYYALPFDYQHEFTGFIVVTTFNWYIVFCCGLLFLNYDLAVAIMVFHLWGQLLILTYNLEHFPSPGCVFGETLNESNETIRIKYSAEELVAVNARLKSIILHHKSAIKFNEDINKAVGYNVACYYIFNQIIGCLLLLECSLLDSKALIRFAPLTIGLLQMLVTVSVIFELIRSMTDHVIRAVYNVPWECMDAKNRKLVLMLIRQAQIPLGLKAMGMVEVGVRTMAMILKTTFSYFMMLRATASKQQ